MRDTSVTVGRAAMTTGRSGSSPATSSTHPCQTRSRSSSRKTAMLIASMTSTSTGCTRARGATQRSSTASTPSRLRSCGPAPDQPGRSLPNSRFSCWRTRSACRARAAYASPSCGEASPSQRRVRAGFRGDRQSGAHRLRQSLQFLRGCAVERPGDERLRVALAARDSGEGLEQMPPGRFGIQKTARNRGVSALGLRVEKRARRPRVTFDEARVDVEGLEPFLHELPRVDREQPAVDEPRHEVVAQLRP